jgi:NodT family efflux transporter outer membrane factor (OMF) lipoprotein
MNFQKKIMVCLLLYFSACAVGPTYKTPTTAIPANYKENGNWSPAKPADSLPHGNYWEVFNDPVLNDLEKQVDVSNQNIKASFSRFLQARAIVKQAQSQYFPTLSLDPNASVQHGQVATSTAASPVIAGNLTQYSIPVDATWVPDLWGRVSNTVKQNIAQAQMSAADLENEKLVEHTELAMDYYELRAQDSLQKVFDDAVKSYSDMLQITQTLSKTGIDSDEAVAQSESQLNLAQAQATQIGIKRAQYEHAIALLIGKPASEFSLPVAMLVASPPAVPSGVPSQLLQRRPDIASAERNVAAANAQIGVAMAAYYPNLTLSASAGIAATSLNRLFNAPAFIWSLGATLAETIFDGGLRSAKVEQYKAVYEETVATYRQTVLTAFQQVEDGLSGMKLLELEVKQQSAAVNASTRYVRIAKDRYHLGLDPYLDVLTAQTTLLTSQQTEVTLKMQQITTTLQLIEALGGGWDVSKLPKDKDF